MLIWSAILAGLGAAVWFYLDREDLPPDLREVVVPGAVVLLCLAWCTGLVAHAISGLQLVRPLGRLVDRARHLRKHPLEREEITASELAYDAPGEWYDLERAINKLGKEFRRKTIRHSREKTELRAIMAAVSNGIMAVDPDGKPLFYNSEMALLFGLESLNQNKASIQEIFRSPDLIGAFQKVFEQGHGRKFEVELPVAGTANLHDFSVAVAPLVRKNDGSIYGAVGIFNDITEHKNMEKMKTELVGNISHELRTPLTAVKGYVETLADDLNTGRTESAQDFLRVIRNNVSRLIELVGRLTDLSDLESGGAAIQKEMMRTREVTHAVLQQLPIEASRLQLQFEVEHLEADSLRVEQVLRNLLQNALRYAPEKAVEISWRPNAEGEVVLSVRDEGPGIPLESQSRIFERFYRVDESRASRHGGRGIGLAIVKHIMQKHGGYVTIRSEPGAGTTFSCHFPVDGTA
jgi:two-component system phosphate regulon sensor histidine kinase PhoR